MTGKSAGRAKWSFFKCNAWHEGFDQHHEGLPTGRSLAPHPVGPIHTPMMREEAWLLGVLARAQALPVVEEPDLPIWHGGTWNKTSPSPAHLVHIEI